MKKLLALLLTLACLITLISCDLIPMPDFGPDSGIGGETPDDGGETPDDGGETPDDGGETPDDGGETPDDGGDTPDPTPTPDPHDCDFVVIQTEDSTCAKEGKIISECSICGKTKKETIAKLDHDLRLYYEVPGNCDEARYNIYKCKNCPYKKTVAVEPTEHQWGESSEPSRVIKCTVEGCQGVKLVDGNGKYADDLVFSFGDGDKAALEAKHNELAAVLEAAAAYDPALHGYAESGELYDSYMAAEKLYEEYSDLIFAAQGQYSIAMTIYYCDHKNTDLETIYNDMQNFYTDLVSKFYSLSEPWYDSMYREFFFYGATEEEIKDFLADSKALSNPEYVELKARNDAIELEFNSIADPVKDPNVPILYAELVENNNRMAEILGYSNYLEYAYESIYDRDYSYEDVAGFYEYVKKYIAPIYNRIYVKWETIDGYTKADLEEYYSVVQYSFFENGLANELFNNYLDDMNMAFTSNPDKQISFSDHLNNLMSDGNLFRGTYEGAYVTYIYDKKIPIAYFGKGYDNSTTIAHEFGHYMNEIYNMSAYNQSYDLLETHSQGHEMLYIWYVKDNVSAKAYELIETYQILVTLSAVMSSLQVDCFEQAIYLNSYDGYNSEIIMADGKITYDEYDLLYASISVDLGISAGYRQDDYWRYGMTITSPCYYVSYSVSAINALQLYSKIKTEGFEAAKESYLKLFTYTDALESDEDYMTTEEVLLYADLLSYNDQEVYILISQQCDVKIVN